MAMNDIYQVSIYQQGSGGINAVNVCHFRQTSDDVADHRPETDLADIVDTQLIVLLTAIVSDGWNYRTQKVRRIAPTIHAGLDYGVGNSVGTIAAEALPPDHAVDVSWYTNTFTRAGRGRNRFPGSPITHVHGGVLTTTALGLWLVAMDAWLVELTGPNGYTFRFIVCKSDGTGPHDVTAHRVRTQLHTLRSRTEGNGF